MKARTQHLTLGQGLAALAAVSLMAAVAPPSLQQLRTRMEPITCANNLRACHQAWTVYGAQYDGVWIAPWDQGDPDDNGISWDEQWPYTMVIYVMGHALPDGEDVYEPYEGGWYGPDGRHGFPPTGMSSSREAPQLQCPTLAMRPPTNMFWHEATNYSYAVMGGHVDFGDDIHYNVSDYPVPDEMTHPATTVLLHDIGGNSADPMGDTNAWTVYSPDTLILIDPHDGRSNYLMCDGHVELLGREALDETMWMSRWVPDEPTGDAN